MLGASITAIASYAAQRQSQLIRDCRLAVKDLRRFRDLEELWAEELSGFKHSTTPEAERRRLRDLLNVKGDGIGDYGEPKKIQKLLDRLE